MHLRILHQSPSRAPLPVLAGVTALLLASLGVLAIAPTPAHAVAGRTVALTELDRDTVPATARFGQMQIDSVARRGYVIDRPSEDLIVFDLRGSSVSHLARIGLGSEPSDVAVDETTHRVYVSDSVDDTVTVIDGDPTSATLYTVVDTLLTIGSGGAGIAVDGGAGVVYVANTLSSDVSVIDLATRLSTPVAMADAPDDVVTSAGSRTAFVTSDAGDSLSRIDGTTPGRSVPLAANPIGLSYSAGAVSVALSAGGDHRVALYDTLLAPLQISPPLDSPVTSMSADPGSYVSYVTTSSGQLYALRRDSLTIDGDIAALPTGVSAASVDAANHRVLTSTTTTAGGTMTLYDVQAGPVFVTPANPMAEVGSPFAFQTLAVGIPEAMTYALLSGTLPPGIALGADGLLSGTPTAAGTYRFTLSASNGSPTPGQTTLEIVVQPAPPTAPVITSAAPTNGTEGVRYPEFQFTASGLPVAVFTIESGVIPPGLSFDERVYELRGTPTKAGSYTFTVLADNRVGQDRRVYTVVIAPAAGTVPVFTSAAPPNGTVGTAYGPFTVTVTSTPAADVTVAPSTLPPGVSFDERTLTFSGTPTKAGSYPITVTADNRAHSNTILYTIVIAPAGPGPTPTPTVTPKPTATPTPTSVPKATDNGGGAGAGSGWGGGGTGGWSGGSGSGSNGHLASTGLDAAAGAGASVPLGLGLLVAGLVIAAVQNRRRPE